MKKCKYCQKEIDAKAKVCPYCKKKQKHIGRWILLSVLVVLILAAMFSGKEEDDFVKDYNQNQS